MGFLLWGVTTYPNLREQSSADVDTNQLKAFFFPFSGWFHKKGRPLLLKLPRFYLSFCSHHSHTHTGCSPGIWKGDADSSVLGSNMEDYNQKKKKSPVVFLFFMKCSQCLFCLQTSALAVLILRGRCKRPFLLYHRLSLVTCRLSTCPASSITVMTWQTLPQSFRMIHIICAINLWFTHCIELLECSHLLEESR